MKSEAALVAAIAFGTIVSARASAETERILFAADGQRVENYEIVMSSLREGDRVAIRGKLYTLAAKRGTGGTAVIYSLGDGKAIRLAPSVSDLRFLRRYHDVQVRLAAAGVPGLKVLAEESDPERFLIVEDWGSDTETLRDVLRKARADRPEPEALRQLELLIPFAERLAPFAEISDIGDTQIRFHDGQWKIGDADLPLIAASSSEAGTVLGVARANHRLGALPGTLEFRMSEATRRVRTEKLCLPSYLNAVLGRPR